MKEEFNNHRMDPELEARIVALVLGEASELEREQLSELIEERPDLAVFKSEIEAAHRLMRHVGTSEWPANENDWKLSPGKRDAVLAVIHGESSQTTTLSDSKPAIFKFLGKDKARWNLLRIAAAVCGAGVFGLLAMAAVLFSRTSRVAQSDTSRRFNVVTSASGKVVASSVEAPATWNGKAWMFDGESRSKGLAGSGAVTAGVTSLPDYASSSKSALSDIRVNLGTNVTSPSNLPDVGSYFSSGALFSQSAESPALPSVVTEDKNNRDLGDRRMSWFKSNEFIDLDADVVPESERKEQSYDAKGTAEEAGAKAVTDGTYELAIPESEAKPASSGKPASPLVGAREFVPAPVAAQPKMRFRADQGLEANESIVAGTATHGFDVDHNGNGVADSLWIGGRTPRILSPEDEENPQGSKNQEAEFDGPMDISGVEMKWNQTINGDSFGGDSFGGGSFDGGSDGGKALDGHFAKRGTVRDDDDDGVDELLRSSGDLSSLSLTPNAPTTSPQDAEGIKYFGVPINGNFAREPLAKGRRDERRTRGGVVEHDVQGNLESAGQSFGEAAIEKKSEVADIRDRAQTKRSSSPDIASFGTGRFGYQGLVDESPSMHPDARQWQELSRRRLEKGKGIEITRGTKAAAAAGLNENNAAVDAFSTFSLHVSDVSFKLAQAALARGEWPEAAKVRIEEFVNAFDYGDPLPNDDEKVACCVEQSVHPFLQQRNLLRVSMRTAAAGRASSTPLRITFLLDNSGSMERIDRQQTVRRAFALLAQQLTPIDQVTLISFARQPRLLADKVNGAQSKQLVDLIDELPSEGGTNLEAALKLAMEKATEQQLEGAQNRIVLLTDGAVNLGDANPESLSAMITAMRDSGIAFDAAGISAEGLNDEVLETLTRKGDGRYYLLDSAQAADDGFVRQIAGALRPSAKNVKVQVEFNPKRVGRYKLLGYEKHLLKQEDFRNDSVDAAEMAAAEAGVAVYQFETLPSGEGDVGSVSVRFRDLSTGEMVENRWPIPYEADAQRSDQAAPSMCIATSAALFAAKLRGEPLGEAVDLKTLSELVAGLPEQDRNAKRVQQLQSMINQALQVGGNQ